MRCCSEAVAACAASVPQVRLVVIGGGDRESELRELARQLGIDSRTIFLGIRRDVPDLLPGLDVACLSSVHEGVPITLIEAMAAGLPIVATDCGSVRDMVEDGEQGFVVPVGDVENFADRLRRLANDEPLRIQFGKSGRARVESEFRIQNTARKYEELLTDVLARKEMKGHILILVENLSVPFDRRVWQESRALADAGYQVTVICPQGTKQDTEREATIDGVRILRYPLRAAAGGPLGYLREYSVALWHTTRLALKVRREGRIDVVHSCNPPDLFFIVALMLRVLGGTRSVFDQHDLVPELFLSRFSSGGRVLYWLTIVLERLTFLVRRCRDLDERELSAGRNRARQDRHPIGCRSSEARRTCLGSCNASPIRVCGTANSIWALTSV